MAAGPGLEPGLAEPESAVLPLDDPATMWMNFLKTLPPFQLLICFSLTLALIIVSNSSLYINSHCQQYLVDIRRSPNYNVDYILNNLSLDLPTKAI